jgi:homoserine kinase type II
MHNALTDFAVQRSNPLGLESWRPLFRQCDAKAVEELQSGLSHRIAAECDFLETHWPKHLPQTAVHADLFPDNVLILDGKVTGLIDFYFACTDSRAYDLAVTHSAWSFSSDGGQFSRDIGQALLSGYQDVLPLDGEEQEALPILARGACLRFLLTRLYDWINTPPGALVSRKDPLAFLRRLDHYAANGLAI